MEFYVIEAKVLKAKQYDYDLSFEDLYQDIITLDFRAFYIYIDKGFCLYKKEVIYSFEKDTFECEDYVYSGSILHKKITYNYDD